MYRISALLLAILAVPSLAEDKPLPKDPSITVGRLPNGLQYWIRPNATPKGKVSILLHIESGSLNEADDQRGLAHFLEHMAFNGSTNFPPGEMVKFFESLGMQFGQHQNAFTGFDQTTYLMHLPDTKPETLDKVLLYLGDVAWRLSLLPEEIDKERGVILEEARSRKGVGQRLAEQAFPVILPGSRIPERMPIGLETVIREAKRDRFAAYYNKWYRPDHSTVIVCGDVDVDAMAAKIQAAFSGWKAPEEPLQPADPGVKPHEGLRAAVFTDPELTRARVGLTTVFEPRRFDTEADYRRVLTEMLGNWIVNRRLRQIVQAGDAPFQGATVSCEDLVGACYSSDLDSSGEPARWREILVAILAEARKARDFGFTDAEVELARKTILSGVEQAAQAESTQNTTRLVMELNDAVSMGHAPMSKAQDLEMTKRMLPGIDAAAILDRFRKNFPLDRGVVVVTLPESDDVAAPTKEAVLAAVKEALAAEIEKPDVETGSSELLAKDPEPVAPSSRALDEGLAVETLVFPNGVRVHCRSMDFQKDSVTVALKFAGGGYDETEKTAQYTSVASLALNLGSAATARHGASELSDLTAGKKLTIGGAPFEGSLAVSLRAAPQDLEFGMRLLYVLATEAKLEQAAFDRWQQQVALQLPEMEKSGAFQAERAVNAFLSADDPRVAPLTSARAEAMKLDEAQAWLDRILRTVPLEVAIVGDVPRERMVELASRFLGTLPKRPVEREGLPALRKVKENEGPFEKVIAFDTVTPRADVRLGWRGPAFGERMDRRVLLFASQILNTRLNTEIRENRGLTYSIGAGLIPSNFDGMARLTVQFTADPEKAAEATKVAREVVESMAEKAPPTEEEVTAVRRQIANILSTQLQQPAFWSETLSNLLTAGRTLDSVRAIEEEYASVTSEQIVEAMKQYVVDARRYQVIAKPAQAE